MKVLSSEIRAGSGPSSFCIKGRQAGLAYALLMRGDPSRGLLVYYADRSLDVPSLVASMNSAADEIGNIQDSYLIDYALSQTFAVPLSIYTFSQRERVLAQDIRDGNTPEKVRRFHEALLKLRQNPNLLSNITHGGKNAICGILLEEQCKPQQEAGHSIFFFVGSEKTLLDTEKRLSIPRLLRIWPNDYWLP